MKTFVMVVQRHHTDTQRPEHHRRTVVIVADSYDSAHRQAIAAVIHGESIVHSIDMAPNHPIVL